MLTQGLMISEIFNSFFHQFCETVQERLLLFIVDGHISNLDVDVVVKAKQEGVVILKLPAHTIDVLQQLDVSCILK